MNLTLRKKIRSIAAKRYNIPSRKYISVFQIDRNSYLTTYTDSHDMEHKYIITL
jgi:hypothetical protein